MGTNFYVMPKQRLDVYHHLAWRTFFRRLGIEDASAQQVMRDLMLEHSSKMEAGGTPPVLMDSALHSEDFDELEQLSKELHIGKAGFGWCFSLHVIPELGLDSWKAWKDHLSQPEMIIQDEDGDLLSLEQMVAWVEHRKGREPWEKSRLNPPLGYSSWSQFHRFNHSFEGPDGLLRHQVDGRHNCIANGEGPWDLITGDFS